MSASAPPRHPHLTPRQTQILPLPAHGHSTTRIAAELNLAIQTVRSLPHALGAHSRLQAIAVARRDDLLAD